MEFFEISKSFPKEEKYSLTDQMRRSSRSVTACIAESWAKRRYEKAYVSKLTDSLEKNTKQRIGLIIQETVNIFKLKFINEL